MTIVDMRPKLGELAAADATRRAREAAERRGQVTNPLWYLVHCGGSDTKAIEHLRRPAWADRFEIYYPQMRILRPIPKRKISAKQRSGPFVVKRPVLEPLWRRYLFIHFDIQGAEWHSIFEHAHIYGFLGNGMNAYTLPHHISDDVISAVRAMEVNGAIPGNTEARKLFCAIGDIVRVKEGAFVGHDGIVEEIPEVTVGDLDEDVRVRIGLTLFGRSVPVVLPLTSVSPR
jgi:transcription antitermination factor NusG